MSGNENETEMISQFMGLTGADEERARFFLESSAWQYQVAVASFFDEDESPMESSAPAPSNERPPQEDVAPPMRRDGPDTDGGPPRQPYKPPKQSSRFATIGDLRGEQPDDEDEEEGQRFYAGGSDHGSGQQVVGPSKKKATGKIVEDLFRSAREHGAEEVSGPRGPGPSNQESFVFRGAGYRLGETADEESRPVPGTVGTMPVKVKQKHIVLKFWKNGFSLDDGPLRDFHSPENVNFLKAIKTGEIPEELIQNSQGGEVSLDLEDHKDEEYRKPKTVRKAFEGKGYKLGNMSPTFAGEGSRQTPTATASSATTIDPGSSWEVDTSQPVTTLQLRLGDGSRLTGKFNHSHTVADIRRFITLSRPEYVAATYRLMTTFPSKVLEDDSKSLAEANLLNAVIVQRLT